MAQTGTQLLFAGLVIEVPTRHANRELICIIKPVVAGEARIAKQLSVAKGQLGSVKIGLKNLLFILAKKIVHPRFQRLGHGLAKEAGLPFEYQAPIKARHQGARVGRVFDVSKRPVKFISYGSILNGWL